MVARSRYPNFDWIRLIAASLVFVKHVDQFNGGFRTEWTYGPSPVPMFLALSGFLVLKSLETSRSLAEFWGKRAFRILPAFFVSLLLVAVLLGFPSMATSLKTYFTFGYVMDRHANNPLWSLSVEEVTYAGLCVLGLVGFYKRSWMVAATAAIVALGGAVLSCWFATLHATGAAHYAMLPRWEYLPASFLIGNALYVWFKKEERIRPWMTVAAVLGMIAVCATPWLPLWKSSTTAIWSVMAGTWIAGVAAVVLGLSKPFPIKLKADVSYGLYIYHFPILAFLNWKFGMHDGPLWLFGGGLALAVSYASFRWIEKPILERGKALLSRPGERPAPDAPVALGGLQLEAPELPG